MGDYLVFPYDMEWESMYQDYEAALEQQEFMAWLASRPYEEVAEMCNEEVDYYMGGEEDPD